MVHTCTTQHPAHHHNSFILQTKPTPHTHMVSVGLMYQTIMVHTCTTQYPVHHRQLSHSANPTQPIHTHGICPTDVPGNYGPHLHHTAFSTSYTTLLFTYGICWPDVPANFGLPAPHSIQHIITTLILRSNPIHTQIYMHAHPKIAFSGTKITKIRNTAYFQEHIIKHIITFMK